MTHFDYRFKSNPLACWLYICGKRENTNSLQQIQYKWNSLKCHLKHPILLPKHLWNRPGQAGPPWIPLVHDEGLVREGGGGCTLWALCCCGYATMLPWIVHIKVTTCKYQGPMFFCTGTKWSMLHMSPVSGFSIVADNCTVLKIKFCYILQLTEMNPTLFVMFKIAKSIMGTMLGKSQNKFIPKGGKESRESIYETTYSLLVLLIYSVLWLNFAILSFWLGHKGHKNVISSSECGLLLFWPLTCLWMNH